VFSLSRSAFWTFRFAFEDTYWPSVGSCISKDADFFFVVVFAFVPQRRTLSSGNARYFSMMFSSSSKKKKKKKTQKMCVVSFALLFSRTVE
jgi:hypothetical protein